MNKKLDSIPLMFIGTNGSMGLYHGRTYLVTVYSEGRYIWVDWGKNACPYATIEALNANWRSVR